MHRTIQELVNAQTDVNRAVFEVNKSERTIDRDYLRQCITDAIAELGMALAILTSPRGRIAAVVSAAHRSQPDARGRSSRQSSHSKKPSA